MRGGVRTSIEAMHVTIAGFGARLAEYDGSMFELRAAVEPFVCGDVPECVVIYLPGCERDRRGSVLMELEKAGEQLITLRVSPPAADYDGPVLFEATPNDATAAGRFCA